MNLFSDQPFFDWLFYYRH